jgi:hypothetical protein
LAYSLAQQRLADVAANAKRVLITDYALYATEILLDAVEIAAGQLAVQRKEMAVSFGWFTEPACCSAIFAS